MLRSAASPGSRGVRPVGRRYEWPPHDTAPDRPPFRLQLIGSETASTRCDPDGRQQNSQTAPPPFSRRYLQRSKLFDLGLAKFDVLLGNRIVFLLHQLVGHGARV